MAVIVHNLTTSPLALPAPFETVLEPLSATTFEYVEYDVAINDARIVELINKGVLLIESEDDVKRPSNAVTVAKNGADFTSIQAAIDSITDAAQGNSYVVQVYPGFYQENIVMKPFVSLVGMGADLVFESMIFVQSGIAVDWPANAQVANIYNMGVYSQNAPGTDARLFRVGANARGYLRNCFAAMSQPSESLIAIEMLGGNGGLTATDCQIRGDFGAIAAPASRSFIRFVGTDQSFSCRDSEVNCEIEGTDDDLTVFDVASGIEDISVYVHGCRNIECRADNGGAYAGTARLLRDRGGGNCQYEFIESQLLTESDGSGTGYIIDIDSTTDNRIVEVHAGYMNLKNFAAGSVCAIGVGDDIRIAEGFVKADPAPPLTLSTGAGAFHLNGSIELGGNLQAWANMQARFEDPSFSMPNLKSGINQGAAGALTGELWVDTSVADHPIKRGI